MHNKRQQPARSGIWTKNSLAFNFTCCCARYSKRDSVFRLLLLLVLAFFLNSNAFSFERFVANWISECKISDKHFAVRSVSKNGWEDGDDHQIFIGTGANPLALSERLYARSSFVSSLESVCEDLPVFLFNEEQLLILLRVDDRPFLDQLTLVLYSLKSNELIGKLENIAPIKLFGSQRITIKPDPEGIQIRLVNEYLKGTGSDSIETFIESWIRIKVDSDGLVAEWL